ncbi:protein FAM83A [Chaetodon auriga]|uniref:protein FAM83A n=1 Tax=Chaetodon auriga TaxID=39042 RepID=UPI0040328CFC
MDSDGASALWYRRSKRQGKVRRRVQDLRIPSCSYYDFVASRPTLDLSHNESTRLAADSLLSRGLEGYQEVLNAEGEVDFLSQLEKNYILENGRDGSTVDPGSCEDDEDKELETLSAGSQSATRCPAMSTDSDATVVGLDLSGLKDVKRTDCVRDEPRLEIYFQSDSKAAGMKDMVREFLRKATTAVAIVTDSFSDVELLCDLLEASRKRNVSVHLLLDHLNLNVFVSMWQDLKLNSKNFPKLSVRSVSGQTYCAKTGEKLTGQIAESFIITDWTEVLTGSYSFSWLSWQVHRSIAVLLRGSAAIRFHEEFHRLLSSSKPVPGFVTHPHPLHAAQNINADVSKLKSNPKSPDLECSKRNTKPLHRADTGMQMHEKPPQLFPKPLVEAGPLQSVFVGKPKHAVGARCTQDGAQTNVEPLEKNQTQIKSHLDPLDQTHVSHIHSQLTSLTVNAPAEKNVRIQESNPLHAASPTHGQHRTVCYQPPLKTNSNLEQHNVVTEGPLYQQMNRDRLIKPLPIAEGLNRQRRQWYFSLNCKTKEANTGLQFGVTHPRGHISVLQTRKQDQPQRHHQSAEAPGSKSAPMAVGAHLQPQLQSHSKLHLQPPPRLTWMPQGHAAITRPVAFHSSFSASYGTGQQAGWRPNTSLGRSKSMSDRHSYK